MDIFEGEVELVGVVAFDVEVGHKGGLFELQGEDEEVLNFLHHPPFGGVVGADIDDSRFVR